MEQYKVGEIAKKVGVNVETLRYYERIGLMPKPKRTESGYRVYGEKDVKRLLFIGRAKELGFMLKEIKELLELKIESTATCGDVKHLAEHRIKQIDEKIRDLKSIRRVLAKLVEQCISEQVSADECPILEAINQKM